jgi:hypothetical protein
MTGSKLLLIVSLLTGVFAEECDLTAADIEAFSDKVTVTNASATGDDALVGVALDHSHVTWYLQPGGSHTATGFLSTRYTVFLMASTSAKYVGYRHMLQDARNTLQNLSIEPGASPEQISEAATDLLVVVAAQEQLSDESDDLQSCSGAIESGVDVHATVTSTKTSAGVAVWALDCG